MRTAPAIRHLHFEDLGTLEPLLHEMDYQVRYVDAALDDLATLDVESPDLLVVLGAQAREVQPYLAQAAGRVIIHWLEAAQHSPL
ncbi:hypothetical protein HP532_17005 [Pseudomonas sp. CrR25]|nr:hypothetical protein [Pseudomonas sp. CrR25]